MIRRQIRFPMNVPMTRELAAGLVQKASSFESDIMISHEQRIANAKSVLGLLSLYVKAQGADMTLMVEGKDEDLAADAIEKMIANGYQAD